MPLKFPTTSDLKKRAGNLKKEAIALSIAIRDPRVPWYAKVFMALVLAHTFSPIDLIPDFIPVLGVLDDLMITPLGIAISLKMIPTQVMADARQRADEYLQQGITPFSKAGAALVVIIWLFVITAIAWGIFRAFTG